MRVLVMTVVHHPLDARILHRQIRALVDAGHEVTYAAPWAATRAEPPGELRAVDIPRSAGRRRLGALLAARRSFRELRHVADVVLLHDPELVLAVLGLRRPPTIWDAHEDTAAALSDKRWVPAWSRPLLSRLVRALERLAERRLEVFVVNEEDRARFRGDPPVVPNEPWVPEDAVPAGDDRVVYLGRISRGRGAGEMLELAARLPEGVVLELIGPADEDVRADVESAVAEGRVAWPGFVPNDEALSMIDGAMAGLSLLRDEPNYRDARPTKVVEYMARGIPVITTPTPAAERIVTEHRCGFVVGFDRTAEDAARRLADLRNDPTRRAELGQRGRAAALTQYSWNRSSHDFVKLVEAIAASE